LADTQTCKREVELEVGILEVEAERDRVAAQFASQARLPGFRPGKAPAAMIRSRFATDIRQQLVENLIPKAFREYAEKNELKVIGQPNVVDIHFHDGSPLKFKTEYEVAPVFELGTYKGLEVPYVQPEVAEADVEARLNEIRGQKADYVNIDPRPAGKGDFAVVALRSISGVEGDPIKQDDMMLEVGGEETMEEFTAALQGMSPGEAKEVDVAYPADYGAERLAGKTVRFELALQMLRMKELPELNDDFAKDLGDFQSLAEVRNEIRNGMLREREFMAQQEAKNKLVEQLVATHEFAVPEFYIDHQIKSTLETRLRDLAAAGADLSKVELKWEDVRASQLEQATKEVRASLLLDKIAERESVAVLEEEMEREVQRLARSEREPVAAVRKKLEEQGGMNQLAGRIRTDKTLKLLFDEARKVAAAS
jgi:trigger factor